MPDPFKEKTAALYGKLRASEKARQEKLLGRKLKGFKLSFTIEKFREWLLGLRAYEANNLWKCGFCSYPLPIGEVSMDHDDPLSLGGPTILSNLQPTCQKCNTSKGQLGSKQFKALRRCVMGLGASGDQVSVGLIKDMLLNPEHFSRDARARAVSYLDGLFPHWPEEMQAAFWRRWNQPPVFRRRRKVQA